MDSWEYRLKNIDNLKDYVIQKGYSAVSVSYGDAIFRKCSFTITKEKLRSHGDVEIWVYDASKDSNKIK
jgi:hypothetical protein